MIEAIESSDSLLNIVFNSILKNLATTDVTVAVYWYTDEWSSSSPIISLLSWSKIAKGAEFLVSYTSPDTKK